MSEKYYIQPEKHIPVTGSYDVVVVGGGCAGFAAAVAAARNGAKTLILERFPFFGGTATASLMANIVGIRNQVLPNRLQVMKGIGQELILKLIEMGGATPTKHAYEAQGGPFSGTKNDLHYSYAFDNEKFKFVSLKMAVEAGVHIHFHVYFTDVIMDGNTIKGVVFAGKSGLEAVEAKVVIDASGDGDVAAQAGAEFWQVKHKEDWRLNDCLMMRIDGLDKEKLDIPGCLHGDSMIVWGPVVEGVNGADTHELSQMEIEARLKAPAYLEKLKTIHKGLDNARIADSGACMGIRQTRFIEGEYKLTGEDVMEGRRFDDVIALASNPIIAYYGYRRFLEHEGYDIPYRCLVPKKIEGLLVAGRCMSSDQRAYESWRAMGHVLCIGEAAGVAAAAAADAGVTPRRADVKEIQKRLIAQGAEIGQGR